MKNYRRLDHSNLIASDNAAEAAIEMFKLDLSKDACFTMYEGGKMVIGEYYPANVTGSMFIYSAAFTPDPPRWYSICKESGEATLSSDDPERVAQIEKMCKNSAERRYRKG